MMRNVVQMGKYDKHVVDINPVVKKAVIAALIAAGTIILEYLKSKGE